MAARNDIDRFHLVMDVIDRVPKLGYHAAHIKQLLRDKLIEHVTSSNFDRTCRKSYNGSGHIKNPARSLL